MGFLSPETGMSDKIVKLMNKITFGQREKNKEGHGYRYEKSIVLGPWASGTLLRDPIHLVFALSRYKFVARMLTGKKKVLEIGCGDAFGTPIVAQFVAELTAIDIDPKIIASNKERLGMIKNITFQEMDFRTKTLLKKFDAAYSIDVIEHIEPELNNLYMQQTVKSLVSDGITLIGTPNKTSEKYASAPSKAYHINLHSHESLKQLTEKYFAQVFMFTMNDEVVQTGFAPMGHFLFALGIGVKKK